MSRIDDRIDSALKQDPDYSKLQTLPYDVKRKIRSVNQSTYGSYTIPPMLKLGTVMLSVLAFVAIAQISFQTAPSQADIFDLRFFSHQSIPSLNLASVNTYEYEP